MAARIPQPLAISPGKGLGFLLLGACVRDILTKLRAQSEQFPRIKIQFSAEDPIQAVLNIVLPENGLRLRFDGPDQRLRLIEVLDFSKVYLTYKGQDMVKIHEEDSPTQGPSFKHIYSKMFGPTFEGELIPTSSQGSTDNLYILSYPGIAFSFSVKKWPEGADFVSVLSSPVTSPAVALSIFNGSSWKDARKDLYTRTCPHPRSLAFTSRPKEAMPDEVEQAVIKGNGEIELKRRTLPSLTLRLGETTPQDLVLTLGPPDAIYRKNDRRLSIHKGKTPRKDLPDMAASPSDRNLDTDRSSLSTATDYSSHDEEPQHAPEGASNGECFYNYFSHGFDVFMSHQLHASSPLRPNPREGIEEIEEKSISDHLVATKIILHGNVPGSHSFNRHRRSRWILDPALLEATSTICSESRFSLIRSTLNEIWSSDLMPIDSTSRLTQRYMVLNRGWGDSPGSSIEMLGGWEDAGDSVLINSNKESKDDALENTELHGWPGLLFEVLKNDTIGCLTVY